MPRVSEDTVNDLMGRYLLHHGLRVLTQETTPSVSGGFRQPDFWLSNDGDFLGEGEWLGKRWEGFVQARDYSELPEANGAFLIGYPEGLRSAVSRRWRSGQSSSADLLTGFEYTVAFLRPGEQTDIRRLPLERIPEWLHERIYQTAPPIQDVDEVIQLLRQTVGSLTRELSTGALEELNLFRNLLGGDPSGHRAREAARNAAGYLLLNQIAFYRVLSHNSPERFPPIDPDAMADPADLHDYFKAVLKVDYMPVFAFPVAKSFTRRSLRLLQKSVKAVYGLAPETISQGTLGKVFHELIPLEVRKPIAAYYTLEEAAQLLANLAIDNTEIEVMDPACGSGTLLASSYRRIKALIERDREQFTEKDHRMLVEERLTGIDIMAFAAHLSTIHLALQAPSRKTNKVRIGIHDATVLQPGSEIPPISLVLPRSRRQRKLDDDYTAIKKEMVKAGVVFPSDFKFEPIHLDNVDLVIMNPPFTRHQRLSRFDTNYLRSLREQFEAYGQYINQRMPYCNYFLLLADRFLRKGGRIAAVLPATILRGDSSVGIRQFLREGYRIEAILVRDDQRNFSEDTAFQEVLLVARKGEPQGSTMDFIILHQLDGNMGEDIREGVDSRREPGDHDYGSYLLRRIPTSQVAQENWFRPLSVTDSRLLDLLDGLTIKPAFEALGRIASAIKSKDQAEPRPGPTFPRFSINEMDCQELRSDKWQVARLDHRQLVAQHLESGDQVVIPRRALRPLFRRIPHRSRMDVTDLEEFIVADRFPTSPDFQQLSEVRPVRWPQWKRYLDSRTSCLGVADRFNIASNGTRLVAYYDNNERVWARIPAAICGLEPNHAKMLALWFNSTPGIVQLIIERMPTEGAWMQFHKFILKDMKVPNPQSLDKASQDLLLTTFDRLALVEFPSIREQFVRLASKERRDLQDRVGRDFDSETSDLLGIGFPEREQIDDAVLEAVGLGTESRSEIKSWLYDATLEAILILYEIMGGT